MGEWLYDRDMLLGVADTVTKVRRCAFAHLHCEHLVTAVADLGRSQRHTARS
ncbi:MAG: DUF29 family protein [Pseudanabaenaceae cyanobacterium]